MEHIGRIIGWTAGIIGGLATMIGAYVKVKGWINHKVESKTCAEVVKQTGPLNDAMRAVLRCLLVQTYEQSVARQSISIMAMQSAEAMYTAYHGLQGNGFIDGLMDDIRQLPKGG